MSAQTNKLIYIVDDDKNVRRSLQIALQNKGYDVQVFHEPLTAFNTIKVCQPDVLILDIRMGEISGIDLFRKLLAEGFEIPVIFISASATSSEAVSAVQMGAFDFLEKPFSPDKLQITIERCLELKVAKEEIQALRAKTADEEFLGQSTPFKNLLQEIGKVANTNVSVLITGESGTGKELIAKKIHQSSKVARGPFIKVNCSAIPENLIESELFGFNKGAFTGADKSKKGYFELADRGTIFLDEIGEMSLNAQAKVLRVIQNMEIQKLGSEHLMPIQVRIIAATNRNLSYEVQNSNFREDLFYRLNVFPIRAPSLKERKSDIPILADFFLREFMRINETPPKLISIQVLEKLMSYDWPGNIRELKNTVERMAIVSGQTIEERHLLLPTSEPKVSGQFDHLSLKEFRNKVERKYIIEMLKKTGGNISEASDVLQVERTYLHKKIHQLEIKKRDYFI